MIVESLTLEGFRCFVSPFTLGGLSPGLNILHGPNGAGKSTLLRALRHALVDSYNLTGAPAMAAMKPWGRQLSPSITVQLSHAGERWRIHKRFFQGPYSRLERFEKNAFQPISEASAADSRIREMLDAKPGKGLTAEANLGLLQVLWTPQGAAGAVPEWNAGVRAAIEAALGSVTQSPAAERIMQMTLNRYLHYFTPGGKHRTGTEAPIVPLQEQAVALQGELESLRAAWLALQDRSGQLAQRRAAILEAEGRLMALQAEGGQAESAAAAARLCRQNFAALEAARLQAQMAYEEVGQRLQAWRTDRQQHAALQSEIDRLQRDVADAEAQSAAAQTALDAAHARTVALETEKLHLETVRQQADAAVQWEQLSDQIRTLSDQLAQFWPLKERFLQADEASKRLRAPDAAELAAAVRLEQDLRVAEVQLDAASLRLSFLAETAVRIEEANGQPIDLPAGQSHIAIGSTNVSLRIPGVGHFTASAANPAAEDLAGRAAALDESLQQALTRWSVTSVNHLRQLALDRQQVAEQIRDLKQEIRLLLRDRKEADLTADLQVKQAMLNTLTAQHPSWADTPPDAPSLLRGWRELSAGWSANWQPARDAESAAAARVNSCTAAFSIARTGLQHRRDLLMAVETRLAHYAASASLPELEQREKQAALAFAVAQAQKEAAQRELTALGPDPESAADRLRRELETTQNSLEQLRRAAAHLEGELQAVTSQNLYGQLAECEERLAMVRQQLERATRAADAIRLLKSALDQAQSQMTAAVPERVAERANRYWTRIAGPEPAPVIVDAQLRPAAVRVAAFDAPIADLSGGESEQLAFAVRLALATELSANERQLAVFDDAFLATDNARADRIRQLLIDAATGLQILVLTCHPARYEQCDGARMFNLSQLRGLT